MGIIRTGIIGCGNISDIYLINSNRFTSFEIVACADIFLEKAQEKVESIHVGSVKTIDEVLKDTTIDLVINLTPPGIHEEISLAILASGKHVYSEKPLSTDFASAKRILAKSAEMNLRVGCAPDTFLGAAVQTAKQIIAADEIGQITAFTAAMTCHGHEGWHPNPDFYYQSGGGPLFDMGPYYLNALIECLGPVDSVCGKAKKTFPTRCIGSGAKAGFEFPVEVETHIQALLDFKNGIQGFLLTSFDVWQSHMPHIEIHGTKGTLLLPDPNMFGGDLKIYSEKTPVWTTVPCRGEYNGNDRGIGVDDMCRSIQDDRAHRASGERALHVVEVMEGILVSAQEQKYYYLDSTC